MALWIVPTVNDVLSEFTPAESASIATISGGDNTKLAQILKRTVAEVRGYIEAGDYPVDPHDDSVPPSVMTDVVAITRWRLLVSAPQLKQLQTQERYQMMLDSIKKLQMIASQALNVESPSPSNVITTGMWNSENKIIMRTHPTPAPSTQFQIQQGQPAYANPNAPADSP